MNILRSHVKHVSTIVGKLTSTLVLVTIGLGAGGCASEAEPGANESDVTAEKPLHSFGAEGINGVATSKYNTCSIKQGGMMNNVLTVKCTQPSVGSGICNGTMTIGLKQGLSQKGLQTQTYTPDIDISKNTGWVAKDGVKCVDGESVTLVVKMSGETVSSITLNGSSYSFR